MEDKLIAARGYGCGRSGLRLVFTRTAKMRSTPIELGNTSPLSLTGEAVMTVVEEGDLNLSKQLSFLDNRRVNRTPVGP